jgi:hypothetical protein
MRGHLVLSVLVGVVASGLSWADDSVPVVAHREFQAVNAAGESIYTASAKATLEGIVLNNPADMLDPTADDSITAMFNMGGQWQIFFQGEGDDHAGTAVWFGQLYNNLPWVMPDGGYSNEQWIAELKRINAARFTVGDRIRVTGYFLSYNGKLNINEQHNNNPDHDFTVELVEPDFGLPKPELVSLDDLKDDQDRFIFDPERLVGGERYQGRLVKIADVNVVDPNGWGPQGELTVTDGVKTLPVKLGRGNGIYAGSFNLTQPCDIIGILDQESSDLKGGYRLWVMNYDGNGSVLAAHEHRMADRAAALDPNEMAASVQ